jgi:brefeldin A-resistance guanine nucleotide exchange factor 1
VAKGDELKEAVPEALKNILLVMASLGVLTPAAPGGLWDLTWKAAAAISPTLEAESLLNN